MQQNDNLLTCLLVQTIDGQQVMRLVTVERNVFAELAKPMNQIPQQSANPIAQQPMNQRVEQPIIPIPQQPQNSNAYPTQPQIGASYIQGQQSQIVHPPLPGYNPYGQIHPSYVERRIEVPPPLPLPRPPSPPSPGIIVPPDEQLLEMRQKILSSYNKICCFIVFFLLIHFGCFVICLLLQGSILALTYYAISGGILVLSMCCACCGARNSILWLQTIHFIVLTISFALGIVAFASAVKHPVLYEYQPKGCVIFNTRLLDETLNTFYDECKYIKQNYPQYYTEFQSECDYQIQITEDPSLLDPVDDESYDCVGTIVDVQEYETSLQKGIGAAYGFAFLLFIILYYYFTKTFKQFYTYNKNRNLRDQINQREQINQQ